MTMQRKWRCVCIGAVAAVAMCVSALAADVTANTAVNMRSGPDNSASVVCVLPKNASAEKLGNSGNWIKVKYKGKTGYVYKKYLKDAEATTVYVTASSLNVREKPNTSAKTIGTLKKNTAVEVKSSQGDWYQITYNGKTGYISKKYTTTTKPATAQTTTTIYTTADLNVRAKPDKSGKQLGWLKKGTAVETYGKTNGWYQIKYKGQTAYISGKYVTTTKPTTAQTTTTIYTTADLNVRAKPDKSGKQLGWLKKGTAVETYGKTNGWYQIKYKGQTAYISGKYVTTTKPTTAQTTTTIYTTADLNVRAKPDKNSKKIGWLKKGKAVESYEQTNGWYKIDYNGQTGYISAKYTTTKKP
ncbi:MAG: SH3 domain-containing protein [Eubacteriales bacterium]|nr:SH3 domain-containing protein [Eubacteriales bacterium]